MVKARVGAHWRRTLASDPWLFEFAIVLGALLVYVYFRCCFEFAVVFTLWEWSFASHLRGMAGFSLYDLWQGIWWLSAAFFLVLAAGHVLAHREERSRRNGRARVARTVACLALAVIAAAYLSSVPGTQSRSEFRAEAEHRYLDGPELSFFRLAVLRDMPGARDLCESLLVDADPGRRLLAGAIQHDLGRRDDRVRAAIRSSLDELVSAVESGDPSLGRGRLACMALALRGLRSGAIREPSLQRELHSGRLELLEWVRAELLPWWSENRYRFE